MLWFILGLILIGVAVILFFVKVNEEQTTGERDYAGRPRKVKTPVPLPRVIPATVAVLGVLAILLSMFTAVGAKNVGVITSFGAVSDRTLNAGPAFKAPWQKVTDIDGTVQTDEYKGSDCIYVRIGDGSRSCVTVTHRWRINPQNANTVYSDYRSDNPTESFRDAVVSTQMKAAIQEVLAKYNPIASLEVVNGNNAQAVSKLSFAPDYAQVSRDIAANMATRKGHELYETQDLTVSYVSLSESTQKKLDAFIAAVGDTRIAAQKKSTATQEAAANKILSASVSNNPGVLESKCLDIVLQATQTNYQFPAGFTCLGGGSPVAVVPKG